MCPDLQMLDYGFVRFDCDSSLISVNDANFLSHLTVHSEVDSVTRPVE